MMRGFRQWLVAASLIALANSGVSASANEPTTGTIRAEFQNPSKAYRPMARWWWPGNDVAPAEIRREVAELDSGGFGGAEIQPLSMNFPRDLPAERRARIFSVGTPGYFQNVRAAVEEARQHGMWIDVTLGSGWPAGGGEAVTPELTNVELRYSEVAAKGGEHFHGKLDLPSIGASSVGVLVHTTMGDPLTPYPSGWRERMKARARTMAVLAFQVRPAVTAPPAYPMPGAAPTIVTSGSLDPASMIDLTPKIAPDGTLDWQAPAGDWHIFAFRQVAMDDQVMGNAIAGPRLIVDHFNPNAFASWMHQFGDPMTAALGGRYGQGMRALFYDSLEIPADLYWSDDFLQQFERRRGYSLVRYLPLIVQFGFNNGYSAAVSPPLYDLPGTGDAVRRDYWKTVGELMTERFYQPFNAWAHDHHLLTRTQAHGAPVDLLAVYGQADIPETEQMSQQNGSTTLSDNFLKIASSAADIAGHKTVSSESFAFSGDPYWTTPDAILDKANRFLVAGINQIVWHGYPYRYDDRPFPGWGAFSNGSTSASFATFMNSRNPFWPHVSRINAYISRLQMVSRNGVAVTPVALLDTRIGYPLSGMADPVSVAAMSQAGYAYSHINAAAIIAAKVNDGVLVTSGGARFRAIVIDNTDWLEPELAAALVDAASHGVGVVVLGPLPDKAASQRDFAGDSQKVRDAVAALAKLPRFRHVDGVEGFASALGQLAPPNVHFISGPSVPFLEKRIGVLDSFFFRNPESKPVTVRFEVGARGAPQIWDAMTGTIAPYREFSVSPAGNIVTLSLPQHGSALLVFDPDDRHSPASAPIEPGMAGGVTKAINGPWRFSATGHVVDGSEQHVARQLPQLIDWASDPELKGFSGRGTYTTMVQMAASELAGARQVTLDLGTVRDIAEVRINGKSAHTLLRAPYAVDVSGMVHAGVNRIEITTVNSLSNAGSPRSPVYPMLDPSMEAARSYVPRSSGLLGPVSLRVSRCFGGALPRKRGGGCWTAGSPRSALSH